MRRWARGGWGLLLLLAPASMSTASAEAQVQARSVPEARVVAGPPPQVPEPFVPASHWSRDALRRLAARGLLEPGEVATGWPVRRSRVRALLAAAEGELGRALLTRFEAEYPEPPRAAGGFTGGLELGWGGASGLLLGGTHDEVEGGGWEYRGPVAAPDAGSVSLRSTMDVPLGSALVLSATVAVGGETGRAADGGGRGGDGGIRAEAVYAAAGLGDWDAWIGRRAFSVGPAIGGGVVLSDGVLFHGVGLEAHRGWRLPGVFARLGPVRGSTILARLERSGEVGRPWFWAARVGLAPRPDLSIGLNRATIFGGEGNDPMTFRNVGLMLLGFTEIGSKSSDFENQVASVDLLWHTGPRRFPLLVRGEWGFSDVGGAWFRVPGIVAALEAPSTPGFPALALGIEHASFSGSGNGHPPWYRHGPLGEGWSDRGRLLGHGMGGHGTEWGVRFRIDPTGDASPLEEVSGRFYQRARGEENLLAPDRAGVANGGALRVRARRGSRVGLEAGVEWERGSSGWRSWSGGVATRLRIGAGGASASGIGPAASPGREEGPREHVPGT